MNLRTKGTAGALAVAICLMSPALAGAQQLDHVTLGISYVPNIQFAPLYVGMNKGYYRDASIALDIQYGFDIDIFSLLAANKIDVGLSDGDQLIIAGSKGMNLDAVYQYYQAYPIAIIAKKGVVDTPAGFAGKTIGVPEVFGTTYIGLQLFLKRYGLENSAKVVKIGYTQIPSLLSGKVDGAVVFTTNEAVKIDEMNVPINEWDVKDFSDVVGSSFISSGKIASSRRDVLERFFAATSKAAGYAAQHPDEAVDITMKYLDGADSSQKAFLKSSLQATLSLMTSAHGFGYISAASYQDSIKTLADLGLIGKPYSAQTILLPLDQANSP